jgi:tetratricopeptide (TPR) repeat protein
MKNIIKILVGISIICFFGCSTTSGMKNEEKARAAFEDGEKYIDNNEYDKAIEKFNDALKIDQNYSLALSGLGFAFYMKGDFDTSINYCNQAIKADINNERGYRYLGYIYDKNKDYNRAIEYYNQSLKIKQTSSGYRSRGSDYVRIGNDESAIEDFIKAIELDNKDDFSYGLLSALLYNNHLYSKSITYAKIALEINPNNDAAKGVLEMAERNGISISDAGKANINVTLSIGETMDEYLNEYPYLRATSLNTLIDNRSSDTGVTFLYYFDEITHKLKSVVYTNISKDKGQWFNNILTDWLASKDNIQGIGTRIDRSYVNLTPMAESEEYRVTQMIENKTEYAALYYVIEYFD